jgi:hypothetical protein
VYLPKQADWLDSFLLELLAFPNGRHDDQVDSVSQFLKWAMTRRFLDTRSSGLSCVNVFVDGQEYGTPPRWP